MRSQWNYTPLYASLVHRRITFTGKKRQLRRIFHVSRLFYFPLYFSEWLNRENRSNWSNTRSRFVQDPLHDGRAKEARRDTSLRDLLEQLLTSLTMDTLESPSTRPPLSKAAFLCQNSRSRISNSNFLIFLGLFKSVRIACLFKKDFNEFQDSWRIFAFLVRCYTH